MIVIDGIDFVWTQTCQVRTNPEDLLHEFLTMSRLKISTIRFDGASEFGKSSSFISYSNFLNTSSLRIREESLNNILLTKSRLLYIT